MGTLTALLATLAAELSLVAAWVASSAAAGVDQVAAALKRFVRPLNQALASARRLLHALTTPVEEWAGRLYAAVVGTMWGLLLVAGLGVAALLLRLAGVDDVYGALRRRTGDGPGGDAIGDATPGGGPDAGELPDVSETAVTDRRGHFSASLFHLATGLEVTEFVVLFVERNGGRVPQGALCRSLPWSTATVTRYLDQLEDEGVVERVAVGNRNVVCLPGAAPEESGGAGPEADSADANENTGERDGERGAGRADDD